MQNGGTLHVPEDRASPDGELMERLDQLCERYVFGHEVGEGGYKHIQGRVVFKGSARSWQPSRNRPAIGYRPHIGTRPTCATSTTARKRAISWRSWEGALRKYALLTLRPMAREAPDLRQTDAQITVYHRLHRESGERNISKYMEATSGGCMSSH